MGRGLYLLNGWSVFLIAILELGLGVSLVGVRSSCTGSLKACRDGTWSKGYHFLVKEQIREMRLGEEPTRDTSSPHIPAGLRPIFWFLSTLSLSATFKTSRKLIWSFPKMFLGPRKNGFLKLSPPCLDMSGAHTQARTPTTRSLKRNNKDSKGNQKTYQWYLRHSAW